MAQARLPVPTTVASEDSELDEDREAVLGQKIQAQWMTLAPAPAGGTAEHGYPVELRTAPCINKGRLHAWVAR